MKEEKALKVIILPTKKAVFINVTLISLKMKKDENIQLFYTSMQTGEKRMGACCHYILKEENKLAFLLSEDEWCYSGVMKWSMKSILLLHGKETASQDG